MTTHLVTGGAGFLGSRTARALHERGDHVRVLDIINPEVPLGVENVRADILDRARLREALEGVDVVHHTAALVPLTKAGARLRHVNVEGTQNVLDAARQADVKLFIHVSTSAVFGLPERCPITEDTPLLPVEPYGRAKLEAEQRVRAAARQGLPCAIVRPRTLIGAERLGIFGILFEWIREGRRIYVIGGGDHLFQFLHVDDAVSFMLQLADRRKTGIYNIGAERFGTLRDDLSALIRHAGTPARVVGTPPWLAISLLRMLDILRLSPLAPWHYLTYHKPFYFDISAAVRDLDWRPRYSNQAALIESYDWFFQSEPSRPIDRRSTHRRWIQQRILDVLKRIS